MLIDHDGMSIYIVTFNYNTLAGEMISTSTEQNSYWIPTLNGMAAPVRGVNFC